MKRCFHTVTTIGITCLSSLTPISHAQVGPSYLSAPDGTPERALIVNADGHVGIGTDKPTAALDVAGRILAEHIFASGQIRAYSGDTGGEFLIWDLDRLNTGLPTINLEAQGDRVLQLNALSNVVFGVTSREVMRITGRYVGIGTTSPEATLEIATTATDGALLNLRKDNANNSYNFINWYNGTVRQWAAGVNGSGDWFVQRDAATGNFIVPQGNVGIGTGSPGTRLDVVGDARVSAKLTCQVLEVTSDRNAKTKLVSLNRSDVLDKLLGLEVFSWEYTNAPSVRHYGAMAQDFHAKFGLGSDDKHINPLDAASVALVGVQVLAIQAQERDERLAAKDAEIVSLKREVDALKKDMRAQQDLAGRIARLEKLVAGVGHTPAAQQASYRTPADSASLAAE